MQRLRANGAEFEYETVGSGEPLVLIHGSIIGDAFKPLLAESVLTSRYQVTSYHRRGLMGSSRHNGPFSLADQAADALAVIRQVANGRAHVVGHSYGGATALQLTLDAQDAVHSLVLLEPAGLPVPSAEAFFARIGPIVASYESGDRRGAVDAFLTAVSGPDYRSGLDAAVPGWFEQSVADIDTFFQVELPALGEWQFTEEFARHISQPVLSVLGGDSGKITDAFPEGHALLQSWLPQAVSFVLPGATLGLQMQNPRGLAEALVAFLVKHPMPARTLAAAR